MISVARLQAANTRAASTDTVLLADMIERAVAFIQTQTRRYFGPITEFTDYRYGAGGRSLWLTDRVIPDEYGEVMLLEERPYPGGTATPFLIADYAVRTGPEASDVSRLVRLGGYVWTDTYEYAVTYERGYNVDNGPPDITQLVIDLVALKLKLRGFEGMRSETIGGYSYTRFGEGDLDAIDGARSLIKAWRPQVLA